MEIVMLKKILLGFFIFSGVLSAGQFDVVSNSVNCELGQKELGEGKWDYACTAMAIAGASILFHTPCEQLSPADIFYTIQVGGSFYNTFNTCDMLAPDDSIVERFNHFMMAEGEPGLTLQPLKIGIAQSSVNVGMNVDGIEGVFTFHHLINDLFAAYHRIGTSVGAIITIAERSYALVVRDEAVLFFDSHHNALSQSSGAMAIKFVSSGDAIDYLQAIFNGYEFTVTFVSPQDLTYRRSLLLDDVSVLYEDARNDFFQSQQAEMRALEKMFENMGSSVKEKVAAFALDERFSAKGQYEYVKAIPDLLEAKNFEEAFRRLDFLKKVSRCFFSKEEVDRLEAQVYTALKMHGDQEGFDLDQAIALSFQVDDEVFMESDDPDELLALSLDIDEKEKQEKLDRLFVQQFQYYEESKK